MPYYRIKVVKCVDAVIHADSIRDAVEKLREIMTYCGDDARVFIHIIDKRDTRPVDKGVVAKGTVREILRDTL